MATVLGVWARLDLDQSVSVMDVVPIEPDRWRDLFWTVEIPPPFRFHRYTGKGAMIGAIDHSRHPFDGDLVRLTPIPGKAGKFHCMIKRDGLQIMSAAHRPITGPCTIDVSRLARIAKEPLRPVSSAVETDIGMGIMPHFGDRATLGLMYFGAAAMVGLLDGYPLVALSIITLLAAAFVLSLWFDTPLARLSRWPMLGQLFFAGALFYSNVTDDRDLIYWLLTLPFFLCLIVGAVHWVRGVDDDLFPGDRLS